MRFWTLFTVCILLGCTEVSIEETLPDTSELTPVTVNSSLAVVDITVDPDSFQLMYDKFTRPIVLEGQMTYWDENDVVQLLSYPCFMEIRGRSSASYVLKSLGLTFSTPIDNAVIQMIPTLQAMSGDQLDELSAVRLRNSGNDFFGTMIKDWVYTQMAIDLDLNFELRYGRPSLVFVNGAFYGLMNIRSEVGQLGLSSLLGIDSSRISVMKMDGDNGNLEPSEGNPQQAIAFREALINQDAQTVKSMIDVNNFIDYLVFQDYTGNSDWPDNNAGAYSVDNGPYRFTVFDLDYAAYRTKSATLPRMEYLDDDLSRIYQLLIQEEAFVLQLENRQREIYRQLSPAVFAAYVNEASSIIEEDIQLNISKYGVPTSTLKWRTNLESIVRDFDRMDQYLRSRYNIN